MMTRSGLSIPRAMSKFISGYNLPVNNQPVPPESRALKVNRAACGYSPVVARTTSLSIVSRFHMLQDNVQIDNPNLSYCNQMDKFLVKKSDLCNSLSATGFAVDHKSEVIESTTPHENQVSKSTPEVSMNSPVIEMRARSALSPDEVNTSPVPGSMELNDSTAKVNAFQLIQAQIVPKKKKLDKAVLDMIESQKILDVHSYPPNELFPILSPFMEKNRSSHSLYRCIVCAKVYGNLFSFGEHVNSHLRVKNQCEICGRVFTRNWLLTGHMRTHTGEKPFQCDHCGRSFADKSNLRSHRKTHTVKSKSYLCASCGRAFAQRRYLTKHIVEVCGVRPAKSKIANLIIQQMK